MRTSFEVVARFEFNLNEKIGYEYDNAFYFDDINFKFRVIISNMYSKMYLLEIVDNFFPTDHLEFCKPSNQTSHKVIDTYYVNLC